MTQALQALLTSAVGAAVIALCATVISFATEIVDLTIPAPYTLCASISLRIVALFTAMFIFYNIGIRLKRQQEVEKTKGDGI